MTILNVDDDIDDIEVFCEAVRDVDPAIICMVAKSGEEALQILNSDIELPQYIFLDINMPKMDGNMCLKEIRKDSRLRKKPVIMYSTSSRNSDIDHYRNFNAEFLLKQNSYQGLVAALKRVLSA